MSRIWLFLIAAAAAFVVLILRGRPHSKWERWHLALAVLLSLASAAVIAVLGFGVWVVYQGSVVLFGKILYTVLAGVIIGSTLWGNVYVWRSWARKYHMRTLRRKTASRLHVVHGGKSEDRTQDAAPEEREQP